MRKMVVVCVMMLCWCAPVHADMWDLYDGDGTTPQGRYSGQQGVSCGHYNTMAGFAWRNKGGDWTDAAGLSQGSAPFAEVQLPIVPKSAPKRVTLDYTALLGAPGVIIRREGGAVVRIATRESGTPPVLRITMADGSVIERLATADSSMVFATRSVCSAAAVQRSPVAVLNHAAVMGFGPLPADAVRAELAITVLDATARTKLQLFALSIPSPQSAISAPPAAQDPQYIWRLSFDEHEGRPCHQWWASSGAKPSAQWRQDGGLFIVPGGNGLWCATGALEPVRAQGTTDTMVQRGSGAVGNGLMVVYHPTILAAGTDLVSPNLRALNGGRDLDEAWMSYWLKFGDDWHGFARCEGGKIPGLAGPTSPIGTFCGNSSRDANGLCGWSLRLSYKVQCDELNPAWGGVEIYIYAYHGLMAGFYGATWSGNERALLRRGQWHCIEQHVRVNTPGQADGEAAVYVDGVRAIHRTGVYLRGERPEQGYGDWKNASKYDMPAAGAISLEDPFGRKLWSNGPYHATTELGITKAWLTIHGGGVTPPGKTAQMWLDEFSVSRQRAGCAKRGAS